MSLDKLINPLNRKLFWYLSQNKGLKDFVTTNKTTKKISRRWIAGETLQDALSTAKNLNKKKKSVSLDLLGEDTTNEEDTHSFAEKYFYTISDISRGKIDSNVSLKLTQMGLDLGEDICYKNVSEIVKFAEHYKNFVRIDMESSKHTQKTIDVYKRLRKDYDNVGIVIQSYLYRSESDIEDLLKLGATFRLCKGAYTESKDVAFPKKKDVDDNFIKLSEILLFDKGYHAFATHDNAIIDQIKSTAYFYGIEKKNFEFQMLYGVRRELQQELVDEGYNLRVYVPYGKEWYPYTMRRFAESWHNVWFIMKDLF